VLSRALHARASSHGQSAARAAQIDCAHSGLMREHA